VEDKYIKLGNVGVTYSGEVAVILMAFFSQSNSTPRGADAFSVP